MPWKVFYGLIELHRTQTVLHWVKFMDLAQGSGLLDSISILLIGIENVEHVQYTLKYI